ncbi:50S ribosomal protein L30 [Candidatus Woesearchaeota archaeon]|nr:50S ribosomal protein L30 [Candidatus Woesearchaeota archaeon]
MEQKRIAIIRIKGEHNIRREINDTMQMLRLYNKFNCSIIKNSPPYIGMLNSIKEYVTWGELNEETFKVLLTNRGRLAGNKKLEETYLKDKTKLSFNDFANEFFTFKKELKDIPGLKLYFRLKPPTKGFERKGTKVPFSQGGALGYRKEKINDLIKKML